ncbi:hypothetical protein [Companilactobacillus furfuricola]|nr:hypothetical protein [Companilactobacillus furfuricola]
MNKNLYLDSEENIVCKDGDIAKIIFNKNQVDALKIVVEEIISNRQL